MSFHLISCHLTSSYLITSHLTSPHLISSSFHIIVISFDLQFNSFKFNSTSVHLHVNSFTHRYMRTRRQIWIRTSLTLPQDVFPQQSHARFIWWDHFKVFGSLLGEEIMSEFSCLGSIPCMKGHMFLLLSDVWRFPYPRLVTPIEGSPKNKVVNVIGVEPGFPFYKRIWNISIQRNIQRGCFLTIFSFGTLDRPFAKSMHERSRAY